jgi:hypothetical protein
MMLLPAQLLVSVQEDCSCCTTVIGARGMMDIAWIREAISRSEIAGSVDPSASRAILQYAMKKKIELRLARWSYTRTLSIEKGVSERISMKGCVIRGVALILFVYTYNDA